MDDDRACELAGESAFQYRTHVQRFILADLLNHNILPRFKPGLQFVRWNASVICMTAVPIEQASEAAHRIQYVDAILLKVGIQRQPLMV